MSLIKTISHSILVGGFISITIALQIRSGLIQFSHLPVITQGTFLFNLLAFSGAEIFLALSIVSSKSLEILFIPQTIKQRLVL